MVFCVGGSNAPPVLYWPYKGTQIKLKGWLALAYLVSSYILRKPPFYCMLNSRLIIPTRWIAKLFSPSKHA